MKDKKNIERIFQETFKDFEETPREQVWENIQSRLENKKRDRKIIPIWFWYAGVAALLLLFFGFFGKSLMGNDSLVPENNVVNTEKTSPIQDSNSSKANESPTNGDGNSEGVTNTSDSNFNSTNTSNSQLTNTTSEEGSTNLENNKRDFSNPSSINC